MRIAELGPAHIHFREDGDPAGPPLVFSNSLGTDMRLWDQIIPHLPRDLRIIRYDTRGHGLSSCPRPPYTMGGLVAELERLLDLLEVRGAVAVGLSLGGMIVQGLAAKRPDLVAGMVLSNTGSKISTREIWDQRIETAHENGLEALVDSTMERWFSRAFLARPEIELWRNMFVRTPVEGFVGCGAAIAGSDLYATTAALSVPTLGIAGSEDGGTPPDLVRETVELVKGARFHLFQGSGHLPCVEMPEAYGELLTAFLRNIGHV